MTNIDSLNPHSITKLQEARGLWREQPAPASLKIDTIFGSVNFDQRMGASWLGGLLCQKVLLMDHLSLRGVRFQHRLQPSSTTGGTAFHFPNNIAVQDSVRS
jgi:hypothetical protein